MAERKDIAMNIPLISIGSYLKENEEKNWIITGVAIAGDII